MRKIFAVSKAVVLVAAVATLAACGASPTAAPRAPRRTAPQAVPNLPLGQMAPQGADPTGGAALAAVRGAFSRATSISLSETLRVDGNVDMGEKKSTELHADMTLDVSWRKPNRMAITIVEARHAGMLTGAKLTSEDGSSVKAKAKGVLGLVPLSLSMTDSKLSNYRGHTLRDQLISAQLTRLTGPTAVWTPVAGMAHTFAVDGVRRLDAGIDREVVTLDPATLGLKSLTMYAAGRAVLVERFTRFTWNGASNI